MQGGEDGVKVNGKKISKQEVTIPGPGMLGQVKKGRLKALSSNKVTGFKLRTKSGGGMGSAGINNVDSSTNNNNSKRHLSN